MLLETEQNDEKIYSIFPYISFMTYYSDLKFLLSDTYLGGEYLWGVATFTILLIKPYFKLALVASVESCWLLLIIIIKELFFTICVSSTTFNQAQKYALII